MLTHVQKWGNSLALRIPRAYADETSIRDGSVVDLSLQSGNLVIHPLAKPVYRLSDLIGAVSPDNRHAAVESGPSVGNEVW